MELDRSLLNKENDILQGRLNAYTCPVFTLPNEIVSEIFVHFLPVYPEPPPMIGRSSPNILGRICREWRDIALSTPALWRGITLSLGNGKRFDQKLRLLETWLQRSGSCLLSIHMNLDVYPDPTRTKMLDSFTDTIAAHRARWEYFRFYSSTHPFPSVTAPLPFLRALAMGSVNPIVKPNIDSLTQALHAAPLLQDVDILPWREHYICLYPWSQLTRFTAHSILPHICVDILARAHNLTYCYLFICAESDEVTEISQNVTHRNLSSLILRGYVPDDMPWKFLDVLTLPALQKLEIGELLLLREDHIASLISRSRCNIQELYIRQLQPSSLDSYRLALPTVGSIVSHQLNPNNPWIVPGDEEKDEAIDGDSDADGHSD
ncbi:hypothetical protein B0H16DRAFT_1902625 [Mycena metata]|uniref:F-box domain-containing protein n=1 Tax=Mycena metata TaxID=1033252 RepID=A0AAD7GPP5_9AGAR|nr:hypothetical protein B0H16DRAFT_1902625 [Mycena metata]